MQQSFDQGKISNLFIACDMIDYSTNTFSLIIFVFEMLLGSWNHGISKFLETELFSFIFLRIFGSAFLIVLVADNRSSSLFVIADKGETDRKRGNRIVFDEISGHLGLFIEPVGPFLVSNPWSTKSDKFNVVKDTFVSNINITETSQSTTQRDTCDDESASMRMFSKSFKSVWTNWVPHSIHSFLNLASLTSMFILSLWYFNFLLGWPIGYLEKHFWLWQYIWRPGLYTLRIRIR